MKTIDELEKEYAQACIDEVRAQASFDASCPRMSATRLTTAQEVLLRVRRAAQTSAREARMSLYEALASAARKAAKGAT